MFGPNSLKVKDYLKTAKAFYKNWDESYAQELVEIFNLNTKKRVSKLSKGMLSSLTIIIALASKADITLLDEPVAGLDVVARERFYKLVIDEYAKTGRTFIISTHIIEEAASLFEKVIIIDDGQIVLQENTEELLNRSYRISGQDEFVDKAIKGFTVYHPENLGRTKVVTVVADKPVSEFEKNVQVEPVALQNLFYAMCVDSGKEA